MTAISTAAVAVDKVGIEADPVVRAAFLRDVLDFGSSDMMALHVLLALLRRHEEAGEAGSLALLPREIDALLGSGPVAGAPTAPSAAPEGLSDADANTSALSEGSTGGPPEQLHRLADRLYDRMLRYDVNREVFTKRGAGFSGDLSASFRDVTLSDPQIAFRRDRMVVHLYRLLNGASRWSAGFSKYLDWVGAIHTTSGGSKGINVEFTQLYAILGYTHTCMIEMVYELPLIPAPGRDASTVVEVRKRILIALNKLYYIHGDFFAKHYMQSQSTQPTVRMGYGPLAVAGSATCALVIAVGAYFWTTR